MSEDRRAVVVGLDVHKSSVRLAAVSGGELLRETTLGYDHAQLLAEVRAWPGARVCQEAGPTGFGLHRALVAAGVESVIVAPGLVPSRPSDRVKTDKRDARRLAGLHAAGLLTEIFIPTPEHEALRDLVRAREDARLDRMRARHRLGKFCLRHERTMPTTCWATTRRAWLGRQAFELPGQQQAFDDYLDESAKGYVDRKEPDIKHAIERLAARVENLETRAGSDLVFLECDIEASGVTRRERGFHPACLFRRPLGGAGVGVERRNGKRLLVVYREEADASRASWCRRVVERQHSRCRRVLVHDNRVIQSRAEDRAGYLNRAKCPRQIG